MYWFTDLKKVLREHYDPAFPEDTVGFLRGSRNPAVWRSMDEDPRSASQMIILGNRRPSSAQWDRAGVGHRGEEHEIKIDMLTGFIILYGGFMVDRPWGQISVFTKDAQTLGFPGALRSFERNYCPPSRY
jgi:hypothetical protein